MAKRQTKAEKIADRRISDAYRRSCSGIEIDMLDIPVIFAHGQKLVEANGDDFALEIGIRAFVDKLRKN